jgi:glutaredoxin-like protein NrdH
MSARVKPANQAGGIIAGHPNRIQREIRIMRIIIYTKDNCVQCNATKSAMDRQGLTYQLINLDSQPEAIDNLKSLGYRQVPVVMADNDHWSGFRPDKIASLRALSAVGG